jgi:hypothetical protein
VIFLNFNEPDFRAGNLYIHVAVMPFAPRPASRVLLLHPAPGRGFSADQYAILKTAFVDGFAAVRIK